MAGSGSLIDNITRARQLLVSEAPGKEKICFGNSKDLFGKNWFVAKKVRVRIHIFWELSIKLTGQERGQGIFLCHNRKSNKVLLIFSTSFL